MFDGCSGPASCSGCRCQSPICQAEPRRICYSQTVTKWPDAISSTGQGGYGDVLRVALAASSLPVSFVVSSKTADASCFLRSTCNRKRTRRGEWHPKGASHRSALLEGFLIQPALPAVVIDRVRILRQSTAGTGEGGGPRLCGAAVSAALCGRDAGTTTEKP